VVEVALGQQRAHAADHVPGATVVIDDIGQDIFQFVGVERILHENPLCRLGIAQDRHQRLVELVRKRPRKLPDHGDPGQVRQLVALLRGLERRRLEACEVGDSNQVVAFVPELDRAPGD